MKRKKIIMIISLFVVSALLITVLSSCSIGRFAFDSMKRVSRGMHFNGNSDYEENRGYKENGDRANEGNFKNMPCCPGNKNSNNKQQYLNEGLKNIPFMGIEMAKPVDNSTGVLVNSVIAGSPAEKAGIKALDIITAADGKEVKGPEDLLKAVLGHKVGEIIKVTIIRSGQSQELSVTLESMPNVISGNENDNQNYGNANGCGNGQGACKDQKGLNDSGKSGQNGSDTY